MAGRALIALWLLALAMPAHANHHRLEERCRIASDRSVTVDQALQRLDTCEDRPPKNYSGTVWVEYRDFPVWIQPTKTWRLAVDNHRVSRVDLWLVGRTGPPQHIAYDANAPDREWAAGNYLSMLFTPKQPVERIVLQLSDSDSHSYIRAPMLARAGPFAALERDHAAIYGIGIGMLALTIMFHLTLFFAMRRRFQLIYCAHVAVLLAYGLCYSGLIRIFVPGLVSADISRILGFAMAAATATGITFVVEFLGKRTPAWLRRWALGGAAASTLAALAIALTPPQFSYFVFIVANLIGLHAILLTAGILIAACLRRESTAGTVALAWLLPIGVSLMYPARTLGLITEAMLPDGLMMFATIVECLLLSFPVASRIRDLRLEHERAHERHTILERQAQTDSLTGLANRRGFGDALARAAIAHTEPLPLALLIIDIDHFKRVNDRFGHAAGDDILRHVAAHVARVAGPGAIVARHGGEEFVVALKGYDLIRAGTIAERIRNSMSVTFDADEALPRVTVSIGVAAGSSDELEELLADADCALYRAKNEGRDRVMLADGPLMYAVAA